MFNISKKLLFLVFAGALFVAVPVFAAVDNFEIFPETGLFNETNLAPGEKVGPKTLTLKNNSLENGNPFVQKIKFWVKKDNASIIPWVGSSPLENKIYIEVKDKKSGKILFPEDTLKNFFNNVGKSNPIKFDLKPGSKDLVFNAHLDESADNSYQETSVSFTLFFNAEGEDGSSEEATIPGTTPGGTVAGAATRRGIVGGTVTGGAVGVGATGDVLGTFFAAEDVSPGPEDSSKEEEEKEKDLSGKDPEEEPKGFWDRLGAAVGDILPPLCIDWTSLLWLIIGIGIGTLGHYLLYKKWGGSAGTGAQMAFLGFLWSQCSFWWLIIGIIIGFFVREIYKKRKEEKGSEE